MRKIASGRVLFHAGVPASSLFAIRQGTVKLTRLTADGDECIESFYIPGDVLGLEAISAGVYACEAITLGTVHCCELPMPNMDSHAPRSAALAVELVKLLSAGLSRTNLARGSARRRVVNFLLDLSKRYAQRGLDGISIKLAMSRREIANLLDTRIETVSRVLQQLHREQVIRISRSHIHVGGLLTAYRV